MALERETSFDRTLTVAGPVELDLNTHAGGITVRAAEGREVRVPPIRQTGNTIRIDVIEEGIARRRLSINYELTVPPGPSASRVWQARSGRTPAPAASNW
ncbi:MAG TPA: hypothetical protein VN442_01640 [Bryobacteraceae bacterium]|nr:hypothetical protein [Bryobacteraceae bacterium]